MKITTIDEKLIRNEINGKYQGLYSRIRALKKDKAIEIKVDTMKEINKYSAAIRRVFREEINTYKIKLMVRKYVGGKHDPTLYIIRNER